MSSALAALPTATDKTRYRWLTITAPAAIYLAIRAANVLLLAWMSTLYGRPLNLHAWDGDWYLAIAEHGYAGVPEAMQDGAHHHTAFTAMAYFPCYPWLVSLVAGLLGGHPVLAAVTVSTVAGVAGAYGVARLARHVTGSQRAALLTATLFAAAPMSIIYSMAYPEALLCALTAWALVGVVERRWMLAGLCAATAGLVRPTAVAVIAVVAVVAAWEVLRSRANWTATAAAILAPTGLLAYYGWVANQTGTLTGYFEIQGDGWGLRFDGGVETGKWVLHTLTADSSALEPLTVLALLTVVALLVISARRMPWPVWAYGCLIVVVTIGTSGIMTAKLRELLPAFVLLIPIAATLARQRATTAACLTAGYVLVGVWIGAYSLTVAPYTI